MHFLSTSALEAPAEWSREFRFLLGSRLLSVHANGAGAIVVLVVPGFKKAAKARIAAANISARLNRAVYVQEFGYEPQ